MLNPQNWSAAEPELKTIILLTLGYHRLFNQWPTLEQLGRVTEHTFRLDEVATLVNMEAFDKAAWKSKTLKVVSPDDPKSKQAPPSVLNMVKAFYHKRDIPRNPKDLVIIRSLCKSHGWEKVLSHLHTFRSLYVKGSILEFHAFVKKDKLTK